MVIAWWAGEFWGIGRWWVGWGPGNDYLKARGFMVYEEAGDGAAFIRHVGLFTRSQELHGINFFGHGSSTGLHYAKDKMGASATYADIKAAEKYTLGLVILNACHTDPGGRVLVTPDAQGGLFAGHVLVQNPGMWEWLVWLKTGEPPPYDLPTPVPDVIKPGDQGTVP